MRLEPDFDMEDFIRQKIAGMKSLEQKKILGELMNEVFLPLYEQSESNYRALQNRVHDELPMQSEKYTVHTTVFRRNKLDSTHSFLRPMIDGDLKPFAPSIVAGDDSVMDTVFLETDYLLLKRLQKSHFSGVIRSDKGDFKASFRLIPSRRYLGEIYKLYRLFLFNGVQWNTVLSPMLFHFFDIVPVHIEKVVPGAVFLGIDVDFGEYGEFIHRDLIPVWNLESVFVKNEEFPEPALDKVNYEYKFLLSELGADLGFLAEESDHVLSVRSEEDILWITSSKSRQFSCFLRKFHMAQEKKTEVFDYPVFSNNQNDTFGERMISSFGTYVKTRAEVRRILHALGANKYFEICDMDVVCDEVLGETYEVNQFIEDEIRDIAVSKTLVLTFESKDETDWFYRDLISYYCSHLQLIYPEYRVVGILLNKGSFEKKESEEGVAL